MNKKSINFLMDELYFAEKKSLIFGLKMDEGENRIHFCMLIKPKDFEKAKSMFSYIKNKYNISSTSEYRTSYLSNNTFLCCTDVIYYD